jgi:hypothetical protein
VVFDIIALNMKLDTIKVGIKTYYLDSNYGGRQCTLGKVQGFGGKQCAFRRVQDFISSLLLTKVESSKATYHAYQLSALGHGARTSGTRYNPLPYADLVTAGQAAMVRSRGYHSNSADNRELVQEPKQSSTSLRGVIGRTDVDGRQIPDDNSILFVPGAGVTTHESTTRSTPARADTGKRFRVNGRATQVHSRGMRTAEAQGVQHVGIELKHQRACSMGHTLAVKARQDEADNTYGVMLRTYAYWHDYQGRPTLDSSSPFGTTSAQRKVSKGRTG